MSGKVNRTTILAGALVGIGVVINTISENKYVGAMLFSVALLVIMKLQLQLYTGQIGYFFDKKFNPMEYLLMLLGNFAGASIPVLLVASANSTFREKIFQVSANKFAHSYYELFVYGIFCGVLMLIAVYCKEMLITVFCIMVFILSGYEHCVADFSFVLINLSLSNLIKFLLIVLGNSVGSIITYSLIKPQD